MDLTLQCNSHTFLVWQLLFLLGTFMAAISLFSTFMERFLQSLLLGHVKTSVSDMEKRQTAFPLGHYAAN